jgi:hypothetical protein
MELCSQGQPLVLSSASIIMYNPLRPFQYYPYIEACISQVVSSRQISVITLFEISHLPPPCYRTKVALGNVRSLTYQITKKETYFQKTILHRKWPASPARSKITTAKNVFNSPLTLPYVYTATYVQRNSYHSTK